MAIRNVTRNVKTRFTTPKEYACAIGLMMLAWLVVPFLLLYMAGRTLAEWSRRPGDE